MSYKKSPSKMDNSYNMLLYDIQNNHIHINNA